MSALGPGQYGVMEALLVVYPGQSHHPNIKHAINRPNYVEINSLLNHGFQGGVYRRGKGLVQHVTSQVVRQVR